jgi:CBS domain-containing protein
VNVAIAALLAVILLASGRPLPAPEGLALTGGSLAGRLLLFNLWIVVFNLLPAFPMDGGRVLRAFLAERMEYGRATQIAASIGQAMAFTFGFLGFKNPFLFFIAFFVYIGAAEEAATVRTELAFRGVPVREAMLTRFFVLSPADPLARAVELLLAGTQHDFPVVENGTTVGLLTRAALVAALGEGGPEAPVGAAMQPAPRAVSPADSLESTFQQMRETEMQVIPVEEAGHLAGLITLENIGEFLMVRSAVESLVERDPSRAQEEAARLNSPGPAPGWRAWLYGAARRRAS